MIRRWRSLSKRDKDRFTDASVMGISWVGGAILLGWLSLPVGPEDFGVIMMLAGAGAAVDAIINEVRKGRVPKDE
jgi:hypothetical protein